MEGNSRNDDTSFSPTAELYFLIQNFLSNSPLQESYQVMKRELESLKLLPKRIDWEGQRHDRKVDDVKNQFPHIRPDYLLQLCSQISSLTKSPVNNFSSLLSLSRGSLNSKKEYEHNFQQLTNLVTRYHGVPLKRPYASRNIVNIIRGREISAPLSRNLIVTPKIYSSLRKQRQTVGHLCAVYCLLFDHTGKYIITGADDLLVKIWSARTGRLIATLRGASGEITDLAVNSDNRLLAAGSMDRVLRVWNMQTGAPVAVLVGHTGMITSLNFCPTLCWGVNYLISTSTDGSVAFWAYTTDVITGKVQFRPNPILYQERMRPGQAQMICSSFSPGGTFVATGSADHHVRVYYMKGDEGPQRILETEAHTDRVDSIQWAHSGLKFLSGSKDGTAVIWHFETQQWKSHYLHMTTKLPNSKKTQEESKKLKVTMVGFDYSDNWVVTAVSDYTLKVWSTATGELKKVLSGHTDEVYVLESHPHDRDIILSAGHDGQLIVWDLIKGEIVARFLNNIEGQGYGAIFDVKWAPDGLSIAASDSHGHMLIFGFGAGNVLFEQLPTELFFHTDYRPVVQDANHHVLDEQTQVPPHTMPPPFLVDIDGNPYPPMLQRLVPGRENCKTEQLVPNIVVGNEGTQEVIQGLSEFQLQEQLAFLNEDQDAEPRNHVLVRQTSRRNGEGIRQSTGEWQRDPNMKWKKNVLVQPLKPTMLKRTHDTLEAYERVEVEEYHRELCRRPHMISSTTAPNDSTKFIQMKKQRQAVYQTRQARNQNVAPIQEEVASHHSGASDSTEIENENDDSDFSESSRYSDWVAEEGVILEPPKRSKRQQVKQNNVSYVSEEELDIPTSPVAGPSHREPMKPAAPNVSKYKLKNGEVPEQFKPSEWLSETKPKKTPYYPQMGDELVYFMQGHQLYLEAVKTKKIYEINNKDLPWTKLDLRDHEFVKVIGIKYEIKPPRLCSLRLMILDEGGKVTGKEFQVKYHDMPDVLDFFILKQIYETAMSRNWTVGNKFRCMIEDAWWIGEILQHSCACDAYPNSSFMCYEIKWANGEIERMSPWDLEPLDEERVPENEKEAVPVLKEEMQSILYHSNPEDWLNTDRDIACANIIEGFTKIMELAIAEPFLVPVDLNAYPSYAYHIEYPVDLSTIKARFENKFYRRVASAQFDVRYLATNAERFNEKHSRIVRNARVLTELCLRVIRQCETVSDVPTMYRHLINNYDSTDTDVDMDNVPSTSKNRSLRILPSRNLRHARDWKKDAQSLLDAMWSHEDSAPFRNPVNTFKYPDYLRVIDKPMDLTTVKENLAGNKYKTPLIFSKDVRQIFQNSKTYNTNKRSRIYVMTVKLSTTFEEHVKTIIQNWKNAKIRDNNKALKKASDASLTEDESSMTDEDSDCSINEFNHNTNSKTFDDSSATDDDLPLKKLSAQNSSGTLCKELTVSLTPHSFHQSESSQSYKSSRKKSQAPSLVTSVGSEVEETSKSSGTSKLKSKQTINCAKRNNQNSSRGSTSKNKDSESDDNYEPPRQAKSLYNSELDDSYDSSTSSKFPRASKNKSDTEESYKPPKCRMPESSSSDDDFGSSYKPQTRTRKPKPPSPDDSSNQRPARKRTPRKTYTPDSEESSGPEEYNTKNMFSSDSDSDTSDVPFAVQAKHKGVGKNRGNTARNHSSSPGEAGPSFQRSRTINNNNNNKRKRKKRCIDSDSEKEVYFKRFRDNDNGRNFTSVSSRGRIRKLTARARAMIRE